MPNILEKIRNCKFRKNKTYQPSKWNIMLVKHECKIYIRLFNNIIF